MSNLARCKLIGNERTTVSRVLFRNRENSLSSAPNLVTSAEKSVSSLWHTRNRLNGTRSVLYLELSEGPKNSLKPCYLKPCSARLRTKEHMPRFDGYHLVPVDLIGDNISTDSSMGTYDSIQEATETTEACLCTRKAPCEHQKHDIDRVA